MGKEELLSIILALIGSGILNIVLSNIFYSRKLRKELKSNGNNMLAETIEKSLLEIRNLELKTTEQEILDINEKIDSRNSNINMFDGEAIYPAIYNSIKTLKEFYENIRMCRKEYEKNISIKIALNLVFIDRYILQSMLFIKDNLDIFNMQEWASLFIIDIQKWQIKFDKMLIKEINKHKYKLESHTTKKWNRERKKELEKQYHSTILHFLLTGKCNKKDIDKMNIIKDYMDKAKDINKNAIHV